MYNRDLMLSWVFGTGEEKTQGRLDDRANVDPTGPRYGIFVDGTTPQTLIYMIHNKTARPINVYVTLDVTFLFGTLAQVNAANPSRPMHPLSGTLWGQTKTADKNYPELSASYTATTDGTAITAGGHLHPGGRQVVVTNLGPNAGCTADTDADGYPGVTILNSRKFDRVAAAFPWSEDYQMGPTKFGWRAPVHKGDVLRQYAPYDVDGHASYQAMSYTGIYVDRAAKPAPIPAGDVCNPANFAAGLLGADDPQTQARNISPERYIPGTTEGIINHQWGAGEPHCGLAGTQYSQVCENRGGVTTSRTGPVDTIHVAGFTFLPGDQSLSDELNAIPLVKKGTQLRLVNEDSSINARHTFTSCPAPCKGAYVANYPIPNGVFDTGKLGNFDVIDGGLTGSDTVPMYTLNTSGMGPAVYTYFCRIHPFMRGAFEIVA